MNAFGFRARVARADVEYVEVIVGWRPGPGAPTSVPFSKSFVGGGTLVSSVPKKISYSEDFTLTFKRIPDQTFRFSANVGGGTQSVFVPRYVTTPIVPTLAERIQQSQKFRVVMDKLPAPIGSIKPQAILFGYYRPSDEEWEVWSKQHPSKPDFHYIYGFPGGGAVGHLSSAIRPANMMINLWGATMPFSNDGKVFHPGNKNLVIGEIKIAD